MKQTVTADIVARIDEINGIINTKQPGMTLEGLDALYAELDGIKGEYELFDHVFEENGKIGLKDITGKVRVPALYKEFPILYPYHLFRNLPVLARDFNDKLAIVAADGTGKALCDFEYDSIYIEFASDGFFVCAKEEGDDYVEGVINSKGEILVPCEMDSVYEMIYDCMLVEKGDKVGFLMSNGAFAAPVYDEYDDSGNFLQVRKGAVWGYLSVDGEFIPEEDDELIEKSVLIALDSI